MIKKILAGLTLALGLMASAQQPQIPLSPATPVIDANVKYVQGVGTGYAPTVVAGLTLNVGPGTSFCGGSKVTSAGGHVAMSASHVNYVFLNGSTCAVSTSIVGFSGGIPIAEVTTNVTAILAIADDRTLFNAGIIVPLIGSGAPSGGACTSGNYNQTYYDNTTTPYSSYLCTVSGWIRTNLATATDIGTVGTLSNNTTGTSSNITSFPLNQSVAVASSPSFATVTFTGNLLNTGLAGCIAISGSGVPTNTNIPCNTLAVTLPVSGGGTGATSLTGYVFGNGTSPFTASTTIPWSAITVPSGTITYSVFGRHDNVTAQTGDYNCSQVTGSICTIQLATVPMTAEPALNFSARFTGTNSAGVNTIDLNAPGSGNVVATETASPGSSTNCAVYDGAGNIVPATNNCIFGSATVIDYGFTFTGCTNGTGQPVQCASSFNLPINMPDASYQLTCTTNSDTSADSHVTIHMPSGLPTTSGSAINYAIAQTMQNGTGGSTPQVMCIIHHN